MPPASLHAGEVIPENRFARDYVVRDTSVIPLSQPRVSVIIPTLDEEKLIGFFLCQFSPELRRELDIEIIVSDGGSEDSTVEIASIYADRVVTYRGSARQTIAEGRNAGARSASGSTLLFFNADVQLPDDIENFLKALVDAVEEGGAATCDVAVLPEKAIGKDRAILGLCNSVYYCMNLLRLGAGRGECHAVASSVFRELNGYDEGLVAGEDFEFFGRLARHFRRRRAGRIVHLRSWRVYEDPRRYRQAGYFLTLSRWVLNFFAVTFLKRSQSKCWEPVR